MSRLDDLQTRLQQYTACETAILGGAQEYYIGTKRVKRADLPGIADMIKYLEKEIAVEQSIAQGGGRNRTVGVIPRDF